MIWNGDFINNDNKKYNFVSKIKPTNYNGLWKKVERKVV